MLQATEHPFQIPYVYLCVIARVLLWNIVNNNFVRNFISYLSTSVVALGFAVYVARQSSFIFDSIRRVYPLLLLPERDYVTFGCLLSQIRLSVVCLSVTFVHPTQGVEAFGNCFHRCVPWPSSDLHAKLYEDRPTVPREALRRALNARESKIEWWWTYRRLYLLNGTRYGHSGLPPCITRIRTFKKSNTNGLIEISSLCQKYHDGRHKIVLLCRIQCNQIFFTLHS